MRPLRRIVCRFWFMLDILTASPFIMDTLPVPRPVIDALPLVRAEGLSTAVSAKGGLFPDGRFMSSAMTSNAAINGALAGARAEQAGLLFNRRVDDKTTVYGATFWTR